MEEVLYATADTLEAMGDDGAARVQEQHNAATKAQRLLELIQASVSGEDLRKPVHTDNSVASTPATSPGAQRILS